MVRIDISVIEGKKYKVLSGVELGIHARSCFGLNDLDSQDGSITLVVPNDVFSLNSSFFAGLFYDSITKLKETGFREKYVFECTDIIRKNVENGIFYVLNTKNILEEKK
ncbi:hypothetical protein II906_12230 [bacterium]|nr:hypothetical protein [bacterium]